MGNLTIWKQSKDGSIHPEMNALKPGSERIVSLESLYPGENRHHHQEPNDVKRILSERTTDKLTPEDENPQMRTLDLVEQLTELVEAQRAYEFELAKYKPNN